MARRDGNRSSLVWLIIFIAIIVGGLLYVVIGLKPTDSNSSPPNEAPLTTEQVEQLLEKSKEYHRTPEKNTDHSYPADWTDNSGRITFTVDAKSVTLYILFDHEAGVDCTTLLQGSHNPHTLANQLQSQLRTDLIKKGCKNY